MYINNIISDSDMHGRENKAGRRDRKCLFVLGGLGRRYVSRDLTNGTERV